MGTFLKVILIMADALIDSWIICNGVRRFLEAETDVEKFLGIAEASIPFFCITWDRLRNRD